MPDYLMTLINISATMLTSVFVAFSIGAFIMCCLAIWTMIKETFD